MSSFRGKIGGLLIKPSLKGLLRKYDASGNGGAPLLGLTGLVVKAHGSSKAKEIRLALNQCILYKNQHLEEQFKEQMQLVDHTRKQDR